MPSLPLARAAYDRGDPGVRLLNVFFETDYREVETQAALLQRVGLSLHTTCGSGPIRGVFCKQGVLGGITIVVSGAGLYKVVAGVATQITATIVGTGPVSIDGIADRVYIATGATLFATTATTATTVAFPDGAGCTSVTAINGYILLSRASSHRYYWINPGETTIDALDYLSAESSPDDLEGVRALGDQVWLFGKESTEVSDPTGDPDTPFLRSGGLLFSQGCLNRATICNVTGSLCWVGIDRGTGGLMVFRAQQSPERISDAWVEEKLRAATASNLRAWAYGKDGHAFYVLSTGNETLACDLSTQLWTQFQSYGQNEWLAHLGCSLGDGRNIAGSSTTGKLWLLDAALNEDEGVTMTRQWPGRLQKSGSPVRIDNVILECTVGTASITPPDDDPLIEMRFSDDLGKTWSPWRQASLGRQGEYGKMVFWTRLGLLSRNREFQFRLTADVKVTVRRAEFNGSLR